MSTFDESEIYLQDDDERKEFEAMVRKATMIIWVILAGCALVWICVTFIGCSYVFDLPFHTEASISWGANQRMERSLTLDQGAVASPSPSPLPTPARLN